jgi:hypothetical protein
MKIFDWTRPDQNPIDPDPYGFEHDFQCRTTSGGDDKDTAPRDPTIRATVASDWPWWI